MLDLYQHEGVADHVGGKSLELETFRILRLLGAAAEGAGGIVGVIAVHVRVLNIAPVAAPGTKSGHSSKRVEIWPTALTADNFAADGAVVVDSCSTVTAFLRYWLQTGKRAYPELV